MTLYEYCKKVHDLFNKQWPYPGALGECGTLHKAGKSVSEAKQIIEDNAKKRNVKRAR